MTVAERVVEFLKERPGEDFCDICIAKALDLAREQQAYHVTNVLGLTVEYDRVRDVCSVCGSNSRNVTRFRRSAPKLGGAER